MIKKIEIRNTIYKAPKICFLLFIFHFSFFIFNSHAQPLTANAGNNTGVCLNDSVIIGGNPAATGGTPPYTYSWQPTTGLDNPNAANPNAFPSSPTNYMLTVTDGVGSSSLDMVSITILPLPTIDAGSDQTILQGTNTLLQGSGAINYFWYPTSGLTSQNSATPTAEPGSSTTYCVGGIAANGCANFDCMILHVIPSDTLIIYNAFTPNEDGINDFFHIGNIQKFTESKIEVFNRNGKLVFQKSPYLNDWDGKIDGTPLPCATYYFVLYLGSGKDKMQGAVTIIR